LLWRAISLLTLHGFREWTAVPLAAEKVPLVFRNADRVPIGAVDSNSVTSFCLSADGFGA
jgi:hypothetical protein